MAKKRKKVGRPSSYKAYVKEYNKIKEKAKKAGRQMNSKKYSKLEWENMWEAEKNTRAEKVRLGKRKTIGNINRDLAREQEWAMSRKQAKAQVKAYEKMYGKKVSINDIREGKVVVDWNIIEGRKQDKIQEKIKEYNLNGIPFKYSDLVTAVDKEIAEEFFGS